MLGSLSDVVSPVSVPDFLQAFRAKRRLHVKAADPARAATLLPWQDLETLISMGGFDDIEVMHDGLLLPPQLYRDAPSMSAFHDILGQGASIIVKQIHLHVPRIQWLATSMERQLGFPVGVNAYLSFSKGGAFKPHWDRHDVLVVQVHGTKSWRIWKATFKNPIEKSRYAQHDITDTPSEEIELAPGDVLYIPRGEPHAASVSGGGSVHLSFGLDALNGVDVLQQLHAAAAGDDFLRGDLPSLEAEGELRWHEAELKARLHLLVDALDLSELLRAADANRPPLRQVSLAVSEEPTDVVRLTLRRRIALPGGSNDEVQEVTIGGAAYRLSPAAVEILGRLFVRDGQSRRDLVEALSARHETAAATAALRELSRHGFLMTDRAI